MNSGIYKITSPKGRIYIGSSINVLCRISNYKRGTAGTQQPRLFNSFVKYGTSNHIFEIVEYCEISELKNRERYWQEQCKVIGPEGLNCVLVEAQGVPKVHTDLTKHKISKTLSGRKSPHSQETIDNISKGHRKNWQNKQELLLLGKTVSSMEDLQRLLFITFPTLKRRLDTVGIGEELKQFWKVRHYQDIYDKVQPFFVFAKNVKELTQMLEKTYPVSPGTLRKVFKHLGKDVEIYEQLSSNRKLNIKTTDERELA